MAEERNDVVEKDEVQAALERLMDTMEMCDPESAEYKLVFEHYTKLYDLQQKHSNERARINNDAITADNRELLENKKLLEEIEKRKQDYDLSIRRLELDDERNRLEAERLKKESKREFWANVRAVGSGVVQIGVAAVGVWLHVRDVNALEENMQTNPEEKLQTKRTFDGLSNCFKWFSK